MADTTGLGFLVPPWPPAVSTALLVPWGTCFILLAQLCMMHVLPSLGIIQHSVRAVWLMQGCPLQQTAHILRIGFLCLLSPQVAGSLAQGSKPFSPACVKAGALHPKSPIDFSGALPKFMCWVIMSKYKSIPHSSLLLWSSWFCSHA